MQLLDFTFIEAVLLQQMYGFFGCGQGIEGTAFYMFKGIAEFLVIIAAHAFGWMVKLSGSQGLQGFGFVLIAMGAEPVGEYMRGLVLGVLLHQFEHPHK